MSNKTNNESSSIDIEKYINLCNSIGSLYNWKAKINHEFDCIVVLVIDNDKAKNSYTNLYPPTLSGVIGMLNTLYDTDIDEIEQETITKLIKQISRY